MARQISAHEILRIFGVGKKGVREKKRSETVENNLLLSLTPFHRNPFLVFMCIFFSGGILGFYLAIVISGDLLSGNESSSWYEEIKSARKKFKLISVFHFIFWIAFSFLTILIGMENFHGFFPLVFIFGLVEIMVLYHLLAKLVQKVSCAVCNVNDTYGKCLLMSIMFFCSVSYMQYRVNQLALQVS